MAQSPNPLSQSLKNVPVAKRLMMALMGGAGVVLLGGGGALLGLNSHLTSLQTTARQKQQEVDGSEGIAKRYLSTQEAFTQTQSRMQCLEASVSAKSYVPTLLGQLQALAAATHLSVQAVRPAPVAPVAAPAAPAHAAAGGEAAAPATDTKKTPPPPYDTMEIDVDTTGTYADTATFLYSLTRFPKIISVTGVQMHPSGLSDKANPHAAPTVTTNLKLIAFMFHEDGGETPSKPQTAVLSSPAIPSASVGAISGAAGRAAEGAVGATKAANARGAVGGGTL